LKKKHVKHNNVTHNLLSKSMCDYEVKNNNNVNLS